MPTLYKIRCFTPTDSAITLYTDKLWHRRFFFESRSTILATIQHNWQCISWLIIGSTKESMLTDTKIFRSRMGAFRCIVTRYPSLARNRIR